MAEKRTELLSKLRQVADALAPNDLIPILRHFWFSGTDLLAYNDRIAISVPYKSEFTGAIPAKLLDLLAFSRAKEVELTPSSDGAVLVKAASTKATVAYLPAESFVFTMPKPNKSIKLPAVMSELRKAIERCLVSVLKDSVVPEQMGITVEVKDKKLLLYSTNDVTVSHTSIPLSGPVALKKPVILSGDFCRQFIKMPDPTLTLCDDYVIATSAGGYTLFARLLESTNPIDFKEILQTSCPPALAKAAIPIPSKLLNILERAIIVTDNDAEKMHVEIKIVDGLMTFNSQSANTKLNDKMQLNSHRNVKATIFEPRLLRAGCSVAKTMVLTDSCMIMFDENSIYMVAASAA